MTLKDKRKKLRLLFYSIERRCYSKAHSSYKYYGAKGIKIHSEWLEDTKKFTKWALANGYKVGLEIDRINSDGNYEPDNCRFISHKDNSANRNKQSNNTSGFIGVSFLKRNYRYVAYIKIDGKRKHLGTFDTAEEGAIVRNKYIIKNNLPHKLNEEVLVC